MRLIDADEKKTRENDSLEMNDCELCYELGIIDKNNCKYCALVNPCIDCADYDVENDICTSEGACGDPDKKWKETKKK